MHVSDKRVGSDVVLRDVWFGRTWRANAARIVADKPGLTVKHAASLGLVDAAAVRAEAERVLEAWPFPSGWEEFEPDPAWPAPRFPAGWQPD
jgi:hypothetical protein